jgi:hypothetical protein
MPCLLLYVQLGLTGKEDLLETTVGELVRNGVKLFAAKRLIKFVFGSLRLADAVL